MRFRVWTIRHADGGAEGTPFARARIEPVDTILVHAAPDRIRVEIFDEGSALVGVGEDLRADEASPMSRLVLDGVRVLRRSIWPTDDDLGSIVILPGGEAGRLTAWRADADRVRWRWSLEFEGGAP